MEGIKMGMKGRIRSGWLLAMLVLFPGQIHGRSPESNYEGLKLLEQIQEHIKWTYVDEVDPARLAYGAADGMIAALDPDSYFLDPEMTRVHRSQADSGTVGVGISFLDRGGWLIVASLAPGSPAIRAGLLPGDRIVEINGLGVNRLGVSEVSRRLRGRVGTGLRIRAIRVPSENGADSWALKTYDLRFEHYGCDHVRARMLKGDIGLVRISEFRKNTGRKVDEAVKKLKKAGLSRLVIDLRNNSGGMLPSSVDVASLFLDKKRLVVSRRGRRKGEEYVEHKTKKHAPYAQMPLAVLVDGASWSAAEVVAAAFQDHRRAPVIGIRTGGKATVQSPWESWDGSTANLTVARYYTPSGRAIGPDPHGGEGGVIPDIAVPVSLEQRSKLYAAWEAVFEDSSKVSLASDDQEGPLDAALDRAVKLLQKEPRLRKGSP